MKWDLVLRLPLITIAHIHTNASSIVLLCVEHSKRRNILPSIVRSSVFYPLCGIIPPSPYDVQWNWVERFTTAHPEKQKPLDIWHESFLFILSLSQGKKLFSTGSSPTTEKRNVLKAECRSYPGLHTTTQQIIYYYNNAIYVERMKKKSKKKKNTEKRERNYVLFVAKQNNFFDLWHTS